MSGLKLLSLSFTILLFTGCSLIQTSKPPEHTQYIPVDFKQLSGWNDKEAEGLKTSLLQTCTAFKNKQGPVSPEHIFGTYQQWHTLCSQLIKTPDHQLTRFFKTNFQVYRVNPKDTGLFTGYYTPVYPGSKHRSTLYSTPVLSTPNDLVRVNLDQFHQEKDILYGKVNHGWLVPYDDRAGINRRFDQGSYQSNVLYWLKNPIDRLFLQIQGSGYIQLPSGKKVLLQFASKNGQPYYPIGRYLKKHRLLTSISMQTIRQWLHDNPSRVHEVLDNNKNFVFFTKSSRPPTGALGVPVTPGRSVAVDPRQIPLGYPVWIETTLTATKQPYHHALAAQDTGSAIKGAVRADIYFGAGEQAAYYAGHQAASGKLFILSPKGR